MLGNINIKAGESTLSQSSKSNSRNLGGSIGNNGVSANIGFSEAQSSIDQTTFSNSQISAINGDSFIDSLKAQGENILIYTLAKVGANEIGRAYHGTTVIDGNGNVIDKTPPTIGKSEQLLLHAGLGAITSSLTGNDAMSGAIAGVAGELTAEFEPSPFFKQSLPFNLSTKSVSLFM